jgi:hypothetical protein
MFVSFVLYFLPSVFRSFIQSTRLSANQGEDCVKNDDIEGNEDEGLHGVYVAIKHRMESCQSKEMELLRR